MVNVKKFLLIPVLIAAYVLFIGFISQVTVNSGQASQSMSGGTAQTIGVGDAVTVSVTRPYLFGLIRLPVYTSAFGNIGIMHDVFFYFILALTVIFIIQEFKYNKRRGGKMAKKTVSNLDLKSLGMPIVWGIIFMFIAYILSGDASSIVIGLLVMYLEYKLRK